MEEDVGEVITEGVFAVERVIDGERGEIDRAVVVAVDHPRRRLHEQARHVGEAAHRRVLHHHVEVIEQEAASQRVRVGEDSHGKD